MANSLSENGSCKFDITKLMFIEVNFCMLQKVNQNEIYEIKDRSKIHWNTLHSTLVYTICKVHMDELFQKILLDERNLFKVNSINLE